MQLRYHSTNNRDERATFRKALMNGLASNYGLYMLWKDEIPILRAPLIRSMRTMSYAEIALQVLFPYLKESIPKNKLKVILSDCYPKDHFPTNVIRVTGNTYLLMLTAGPTYSFKDYAARFFARMLNHFLTVSKRLKVVLVATSGDTGGAVADALYGLDNVSNVILFPKSTISDRQRRQMTTLGGNIYAIEVNGDFDVCQSLVKRLLADRDLALRLFCDPDRFTSANSISIGRLLPQAVYPFFAYSRIADYDEPLIVSVPSGNFGDLMGTIVAKNMGLPISKIVCAVNENRTFYEFLQTGNYTVKPSKKSPSSAMNVSNPSNFSRLIELYGGHIYDKRDNEGNIIQVGIIDLQPDIVAMKNDIYSQSISDIDHYKTIKQVYDTFGIILEPHGAVAWKALEQYLNGKHNMLSIAYETADPGKFPEDIRKAIGLRPNVPERIARQANKRERIFSIKDTPETKEDGSTVSSEAQYKSIVSLLEQFFKKPK